MGLRRERKKARLTQAQLAAFAGVRQGTISKLESGTIRKPAFGILEDLAEALTKCGRKVDAAALQPRRQPVLVKGFRAGRRKRTVSR